MTPARSKSALDAVREAAQDESKNIMVPTIALAHAGGTTGEWADVLRDVFGEYRAPTGVSGAIGRRPEAVLAGVRTRIGEIARDGGPPRLLVAKPGLDGHSNGAEQIAVAARDAGLRGRVPGNPVVAGSDRCSRARRGR